MTRRPFLDITPLQTAHRTRGIGAYVRGLVAGFRDIGAGVGSWGFRAGSHRPWPPAEQGVPRFTGRHRLSRIQLALWGSWWAPRDALMHFTNDLVSEVRVGGPYLVTVHDLIPAMWPDRYLRGPLRRALYRSYLRHVRGAAHVITNTEAVRQDVAARLTIDPDRFSVVPPGVPELPEPNAPGVDGDRPYLFVVGTSEYHKNVSFVIETMATIPPRTRAPLVATGAGPELWSDLHRLASSRDVELFHLGHVSSQELSNLYAGARAVLFPSLFEGFGLPAIEALRLGAPVITSDRGALPEVIGAAGEALPLDTEMWRERILEALNGELRQDPDVGRARAAEFTWRRTARGLCSIYSEFGAPTSR